ncbi:MAG TPA: hypothetical protein VHN37_11080 [Actinomycetota bacterium]|nr:hypothetical protein [Actinomycetota bacterium]
MNPELDSTSGVRTGAHRRHHARRRPILDRPSARGRLPAGNDPRRLRPHGGDDEVARVLSTVAAVQQLVIKTANDAMIIACQSTDANTCLRNLVETLNAVLTTACSQVPGMDTSTGANRCVERTLDLVDLAVEIAQQKIADTCGSSDPRRCVEMATGEAFKAIDAVNDLIANTCKQNIGATTSTSDDAVANCVARVLSVAAEVQELVRAKMIEICGASDANACVPMVLRRAETEVNKTCRSVPGVTTTTGLSECVDKAIQLVNSLVERAKHVMRDTCGSDVATTCADNVVGQLLATIDKVNDAAARACKSDTAVTSPTSDSAVTNCVNKAMEILDFAVRTGGEAMVEICGSTAADACVEDLLRQVDGLVGTVCGAIPAGTTTSSGPTTCAEKAVQVVTEVYRVACPADSSADACGSRYVAAVTEIVVRAAACGFLRAVERDRPEPGPGSSLGHHPR